MKNTQNDCFDQRNFWNKLQELKYEIIYLSLHFRRCIKFLNIIRYIETGTTALCVGLIMFFSQTKWVIIVCGVISLLMQIIIAFAKDTPLSTRKDELREMGHDLDLLYNEMERDWSKISNGQIAQIEIAEGIKRYADKKSNIEKNYFKNDALPEKQDLLDKANDMTEAYFLNLTKEEKTYEPDEN